MSLATVHAAVSSIRYSSDDIAEHDYNQLPQFAKKKNVSDTQAKCSLFLKWRPSFHFIAPKGWMNDPCAPCYDAVTGLYHLFYQCEYADKLYI